MKTRWMLVQFDILFGILLCAVLMAGQGLGLFPSLRWEHLLAVSVLAAVIGALIHQCLFFPLFIRPMHALAEQIAASHQNERPFGTLSTHVAELRELNAAIAALLESLRTLTRISDDVLRTGKMPAALAAAASTPLGIAMHRLIEPLTSLERLIQDVSEGELCIEIPLSLLSTTFGQKFSEMNAEIRASIVNVREEVVKISQVSAAIAALSQQGSQNARTETEAIENISSSIHEMAENLREVMTNIRRQADSLESTFTDVEHMITSIEEVNNSIELLSTSADSTARTIEDIHAFMQQIQAHAHSLAGISETISTEAQGGGDAVKEMIEGTLTIKKTVEDAAATIQRLGKESERIGEIVEVINGIAEQTNLLALNASIIAAQAGEHGRGFSVVAGEIKELAERTRHSTKEIAAIIRSLQNGATQGILAMKNCLEAVAAGVTLSNSAGSILQTIVQNIQGARDMATMLADATVKQTRNSQEVTHATERISQKLESLHDTALSQSRDSVHLVEMATILKDATKHIEDSATTQSSAMDMIVSSIESIQDLVWRNADIAHRLATSAEELGQLESNLSEHMGHFLVTRPSIPQGFNASLPTIVFMYPGAPSFYQFIYQGIQQASAHRFQTIVLDCQNDPVTQAEYIHWLLRQSWLSGIVFTPFDEHTGGRIVADVLAQRAPIIVVDRMAHHAPVTVISDNKQGGMFAVELLKDAIPQGSLVFTCGPRNIQSIFQRMEGFATQAQRYRWHVVNVFTSVMNIHEAKQSIFETYRRYPEVKGVFATNEHASLACLEMLKDGALPKELASVSYDMNQEIAEGIINGRLRGAIFQDPVKLGEVAMQECLAWIERGESALSAEPRTVLVPAKKITKENLALVYQGASHLIKE